MIQSTLPEIKYVEGNPSSIPVAQSGAWLVVCWANSAGALHERSLVADLGFMCNAPELRVSLPLGSWGRLTQTTTVTLRWEDVPKNREKQKART